MILWMNTFDYERNACMYVCLYVASVRNIIDRVVIKDCASSN